MNKKAFSLAELIIVITIIIILSAIGVVSYNWYVSNSRDANRKTELSDIYSFLEAYKLKNILPTPYKKIDIYSSWELIWYQWLVWENILKIIWYKWLWKDPLDESYYIYYLNSSLRFPWVMGFLENHNYLTSISNKAFANDYTNRYPIIYWKDLWLILDSQKNPINTINSWNIELNNLTWDYIVYFDNETYINKNSWYDLNVLYWTSITWIIWNSCEEYVIENWNIPLRNWVYLINSNTWLYQTYCNIWPTFTDIWFCNWNPPENSEKTSPDFFDIEVYWSDSINRTHLWEVCWFKCKNTYTWESSEWKCIKPNDWVCWNDSGENLYTTPINLCYFWNPSPVEWLWPSKWYCIWEYWWVSEQCETTIYCMAWWWAWCIVKED